jgi:hypothetical protein
MKVTNFPDFDIKPMVFANDCLGITLACFDPDIQGQ